MRIKRFVLGVALVAASVGMAWPAASATEIAASATGPTVQASAAGDSVTFDLSRAIDPLPVRPVTTELRCAGQSAAVGALLAPGRTTSTAKHQVAGRTCTTRLLTPVIPGRVDEVTQTIRGGANGSDPGRVLARRTLYSYDGKAESTPFVVPSGNVRIGIEVESLPKNQVGTPLRFMAFNLWVGGTLNRTDTTGDNQRQLIEYLRKVGPDVFFVVEAYGAGNILTEGLNAGRPTNDRYAGVQVTRPEDNGSNGDNLWLYTKLDVEKVYPRIADDGLSTFYFGGAKLRLPNGKHIHAFSAWLWHADSSTHTTSQSAYENILGLPRTYSDAKLLASEDVRRREQATQLLQQRLPTYVDDDAPVFIGGDFNTMSNLDWAPQFARAPGHAGLVLDWPVLKMFSDAGFKDLYRQANPDAGRYPGSTWSPYLGFGFAPQRIDYLLARGDGVRVLGARTGDRRLPEHQTSALDDIFPFYSDHGSVISEVVVRGPGAGPGAEAQKQATLDAPETRGSTLPEPPPGAPVPYAEMTATASTWNAGNEPGLAIDGNYRTMWHSVYSPAGVPQPHDFTIDMQRSRTLTGVRYQPRISGHSNGNLRRVVIQVSDDGTTFHDVTKVEWDRTTWPKNVDVGGVRARYLRFHVELGIGGFSTAAEILPYEAQ